MTRSGAPTELAQSVRLRVCLKDSMPQVQGQKSLFMASVGCLGLLCMLCSTKVPHQVLHGFALKKAWHS